MSDSHQHHNHQHIGFSKLCVFLSVTPLAQAILAQVVFSWSLPVVSENYLSVEAMLQSPPVLSLGGMCFVRKLLVEWVGGDKVGACGPFDFTATTPAIVQHILADDFK